MVLRVLASVVFIPCFIIITLRGDYQFLLLVNIIVFVGMWEFYGMMEAKGIRPYKGIGVLSGMALCWYVFFRNGLYANLFCIHSFVQRIYVLICINSNADLVPEYADFLL